MKILCVISSRDTGPFEMAVMRLFVFLLCSSDWRRRVERCQVFPAGGSVVVARQTFPHRDLWTHQGPLLAAPLRLRHWRRLPPLLPSAFNPQRSPCTLPLFCCLKSSSCFHMWNLSDYLICCVSFLFLIFYLCKKASRQSCQEHISVLGFLKGKKKKKKIPADVL